MAEGTWEKLSQVAVLGAEYDSPERQPHPKCLKGTRVDLLEFIHGRLNKREKSQIIWLHGTAGVGKSAVAFTVAERMKSLKMTEETKIETRLAGTFFFSRKHTKRSTTGHFFATLAYQLASNFPSVRNDVNRAVRENPAVLDSSKSLHDQMKALFRQPLWHLQLRLRDCPPPVFVIDALDECKPETIADLISLLGEALRDPELPMIHILLTSRLEEHIRKAIQTEEMRALVYEIPVNTSGEGISRTISLDGEDVDNDIYVFLQHSFMQLQSRHPDFPQPTEDNLTRLANRAGRRFIIASTMMKFVDDGYNDPRERLELMLDLTNKLLPGTEVYELYNRILSTCSNPNRAYQHLSIVAALADPLPISQISKLLGPGQGSDVATVLVQLRSFIDIPVDSSHPINIYHSSIRDYVSDFSNCNLSGLQPVIAPHSQLAYSSFCLMIQDIPERTDLMDALSELRSQDQAMQPLDPRDLQQSLAFIVEPPEPLQVLMGLLWLRGARGSGLRSWLRTLDGRAWLQTQYGEDYLRTQKGEDWLQTLDGGHWLQTHTGDTWLRTERGRGWLQSRPGWLWTQRRRQVTGDPGEYVPLDTWSGQDSLETINGQVWLQTQTGREWLQTQTGGEWLQTQTGREWLQSRRGEEWLQTSTGQMWLQQTPGGREWLQTQRGREWLQTQSGQEWLQTPSGREWLQTYGSEWLDTKATENWKQLLDEDMSRQFVGKQKWLETKSGRQWLETRSGREWLETPYGEGWLVTESRRVWMETESGREWLETESGRVWLEAESGRVWLETESGRVWLETQHGMVWLETKSGTEWLETQSGRVWIKTQSGKLWMNAQNGKLWLKTPSWRVWLKTPNWRMWLTTLHGREWLKTPSGREWLGTPSGREWLEAPSGREWLGTSNGKEWLMAPSGRVWLETPSGRAWLEAPSGREWLEAPSEREWLGTPNGKEWLGTSSGRAWLGTPSGREWLGTQHRRLQTPIRHAWLRTFHGREWLLTPNGQEWLLTRSAQEWLLTPGGREWLHTLAGREWLQTPGGLQTEHGQEWLQTKSGQEWLLTLSGREWLQTMCGRKWLQTESGRGWLKTSHGQAWQLTPTASVWVTMEDFSNTLETISECTIIPEFHLPPAFQAIREFKNLPDFLMFPAFLALRPQDHSTSTSLQDCPDIEVIHTMTAFTIFATEAREQSQSSSDALKYACQNWVFHLSRAPSPMDHRLTCAFKLFWDRHLLSWLERQWCLKGLRSCLLVLSEGQKLAEERLVEATESQSRV